MVQETAIFAAGCFWHVELAFSKIKGVNSTRVGYIGGDEKIYPNPTYKQVCTAKTRYAEAIEINFNSDKIKYGDLLDIFWKIHDPTQLNRQGPDFGTQYRTAIFYKNANQKKEAEKSKRVIEKKLGRKVTTEITKAGTFYPAEDYHQKYLEKRGLVACPI
ncbi:MAG: peptide-methionine (S)-S-oxide reductase MsrA [Nanoarchaeota archaeon]